MAYSGKRNYKSRRERVQRSKRNIKIAATVAILFLLIYLIMNGRYIYDWLRTSL